jgi:segregation and condensation protein B
MTLKQVVEALVFASPKTMPVKEIVAALKSAGHDTDDQAALDYAKVKEAGVTAALLEIQADLVATGRAFQLVEQVNGWALVSDPGAARWVRQLYPEAKPTKLTGPQLETLAIIAYRQPVTRADIEAVRGVAVDGVMQILLDRALVKIAGRAEVPGRPLLYQTTEYFLQHFGLRHTGELPNADELKRIALPMAPVADVKESQPENAVPAPENSAPEHAPVPDENTGASEAIEPPPPHEN